MDANHMTLALIFKNVHQVMMAEDLLNSANIECDLVPVPREISSECGLAMVLAGSQIKDALEIIKASDAQVLGRYNVINGKYVEEDREG